jgi:hypothetical protein
VSQHKHFYSLLTPGPGTEEHKSCGSQNAVSSCIPANCLESVRSEVLTMMSLGWWFPVTQCRTPGDLTFWEIWRQVQSVLISSLWRLVETDCMQEQRVSQSFFLFWTCERLRYSCPNICHEGMQVDWTLAPLILTMALDGYQWLASHPSCFTPGTHWRGGLLGLKVSLNAIEERKISSAWDQTPCYWAQA